MIKEKEHLIAWDSCLRFIGGNVSEQSYKTWFQPIRPIGLHGNTLTIQVPNKFFYEWLEEHYVALLSTAIKSVIGAEGKLEYQILLDDRKTERNDSRANTRASNKSNYSAEDIKNPFVIPGIKKIKFNSFLKKEYTFDHFIEGDCNRLARSAGMAIGDKPGNTAFNPLFIFGNVGLGKTHLAQAIGNRVLEKRPNKKVVYVSSEKFTNQIIDSIRNNSVSDFVNFYQVMDVLIIDDIQFLANKIKTQEIFFHIFNQLQQNNKQIILTSDRPPNEMEGIEKRLLSRFKWGLTADVQVPDLETRMAILAQKADQVQLKLPANVIEYICYNIKDNIRELEGVLASLIAQKALRDNPEIDIDLVKSVLKNFVKEDKKEVTLDFVQEVVAEFYKVDLELIQGKTRKRKVVVARQTSMYLAKQFTDLSLKAIGSAFGGRDHSTVIYSIKTVEQLMDTDSQYEKEVQSIIKKINLSY